MEGDKVGQSEKDGDDLDRAERGELTGNDSTITKRTAGEQKAYVSNATSQQQRIRQQGELNKVIEYRVCINIYEARKLQGTGKNPALRVACKCGQQVKKTNSRKGSLSPKFNEVKIFTFSCTHEKMLGKPLEIKVQNVKQVLRDGLVGSFKMSLGMVYAQPDHCYAYKWLLLSDPKNSACEMKGYLKVSVHVAGGNDPSMSFPLSSQKQESDEDIETNLLRHAGVSLFPGIITIRVYKGEDFPQMDPDYFKHFKSKDAKKKDLVDPYCTIRFAGHKQKTKIIENRSYPDWNTELKLNVLFPSLSEAITFQAMDYDKLSEDDYIGTVHLKISHISETGRSGFPPTFGPCFVNIYGSTREFESWEFESSSEYVNTNKGLVC